MINNRNFISLSIMASLFSTSTLAEEFYFRVPVKESLSQLVKISESDKTPWAITANGYYNCSAWSDFDNNAVAGDIYQQSQSCKADEEKIVIENYKDVFSEELSDTESVRNRTITATLFRQVSVQEGDKPDDTPFDCSDWEKDSSIAFSNTTYNQVKHCSFDDSAKMEHYVDGSLAYTYTKNIVSPIDIRESIARENETCNTLLTQDPTLPSGNYPLDAGAYYCDMTDGGWTRIANITTTNSPTNTGGFNLEAKNGVTAYWAQWDSIAGGSSHTKNILFNLFEVPWTTVKFTIKPESFGTPDAFNNYHGNPANRESINGQFFDGIAVMTGDTLIHAFTGLYRDEGIERISQLGISSSQVSYGTNSQTITFTNNRRSPSGILLKGMVDEDRANEAAGFSSFVAWVK